MLVIRVSVYKFWRVRQPKHFSPYTEKRIPNVCAHGDWIWLLKCHRNKNFYYIKIYFHSIKINLYSVKYIFITSHFFHDIEKDFCSIKKKLYSIRNIFIIYSFSHSSKIFFYYIWWAYLVFQLYVQKLEFFVACKLNSSWKM